MTPTPTTPAERTSPEASVSFREREGELLEEGLVSSGGEEVIARNHRGAARQMQVKNSWIRR
jgi:hypothetical protein